MLALGSRCWRSRGALGHEVFAFDPASNIVSSDKRGSKLLDKLLKDHPAPTTTTASAATSCGARTKARSAASSGDGFNRVVKASTP